MSKDDVPEWARQRARTLLMEGDPRKDSQAYGSIAAWIETAFARYIAAHEPAPVDPLFAALAAAWPEAGVKPEWLGKFAEELRARGVGVTATYGPRCAAKIGE